MRSLRRSLLFVPGYNPAMILSAPVFRADAVIFDLEDSVVPSQKDAARHLVIETLKSTSLGKTEKIVRINPLTSPFGEADVRAVLPAGPDTIILPKAEPRALRALAKMIEEQAPQTGIIALLETALGVEMAYRSALITRVNGLFLGGEDLTADIGATRSLEGIELAYARQRILIAAAAAGIDAIDTPFTGTDVSEEFLEDVRLAKRLGFTGKACISPRHVEAINRIFSPTEEEILYAERVLQAAEEGRRKGLAAVSLDGKMIDPPIEARARRILVRAGRLEW